MRNVGTKGNDVLWASDSDLVLSGRKGDDVLLSNAGVKKLKGGDGNDIFEFDDQGGRMVVKDFTRAPGQEMDKIRLVGDSDFEWRPTGIGEITAQFGDTTIVFQNVSGRELSYNDVFILDDFSGSIV